MPTLVFRRKKVLEPYFVWMGMDGRIFVVAPPSLCLGR